VVGRCPFLKCGVVEKITPTCAHGFFTVVRNIACIVASERVERLDPAVLSPEMHTAPQCRSAANTAFGIFLSCIHRK